MNMLFMMEFTNSRSKSREFPVQPNHFSGQLSRWRELFGKQSWKCNRLLSGGTTCSKNGNTCHWCTGPGHGGCGMWVAQNPNTCKPQNSQANNASASANTTQKGSQQIKKQEKELTALFTDNTLEPAELATKVSELVND